MILAGGASGALKGGRHLRNTKETTMSNLLLAMLDKLGIPTEKFGDSTGMARRLTSSDVERCSGSSRRLSSRFAPVAFVMFACSATIACSACARETPAFRRPNAAR